MEESALIHIDYIQTISDFPVYHVRKLNSSGVHWDDEILTFDDSISRIPHRSFIYKHKL